MGAFCGTRKQSSRSVLKQLVSLHTFRQQRYNKQDTASLCPEGSLGEGRPPPVPNSHPPLTFPVTRTAPHATAPTCHPRPRHRAARPLSPYLPTGGRRPLRRRRQAGGHAALQASRRGRQVLRRAGPLQTRRAQRRHQRVEPPPALPHGRPEAVSPGGPVRTTLPDRTQTGPAVTVLQTPRADSTGADRDRVNGEILS